MSIPHLASAKECTGCMVCVDSCNQNALKIYIDKDGHFYVKVDKNACVGCLRCEKTCPVVNKFNYSKGQFSKFYAAWNTNEKERLKSASGGVFSAIAHYILDNGGVVIGAAAENTCDVNHIVISDNNDIQRLQGSKYTQSKTAGIYKKTYELLREGEKILFSGTGCQVAGLLSYLKNKTFTGKLITIDLICGGVPSKLLLQKFIENEPYKVKRILSFRSKESGWKPKGFGYNMKVEDNNGVIHDYTGIRNLVTTGFSTEMANRYSCYDCKFVGRERASDFTIGDLWGDTDFQQEHFNGLSLIVAHNKKALELLRDMKEYICFYPCNENNAIKSNLRLIDGRNRKKYTLERRILSWLFSNCKYSTLKKIYANDYSIYSPWMLYKIIRKILFY